ncbi:amino acid adenylation domain-containing protein [Actinoplanes sp. NPDC051346]|uniref:non-ribosomal peptide synthetase n=1 Tax=Actinoplanes sp. NPDC051346 TaxID=3155048 RepID=UPI0034464D55
MSGLLRAADDESRRFWAELEAEGGGMTRIPAWVSDRSAQPTGEHVEPLGLTLPEIARGLAVQTYAPLLAAHAKLLAILDGEQSVAAVFQPGAHEPGLPFRLTVGEGTWRDLVTAADQYLATATRYRAEAPAASRNSGTVVGAEPPADGLPADVDLWVWCDRDVLRVRYDTSVVDHGHAARIGGYLRRAVALMTTDADSDHRDTNLLGAEEVRYQLDGLAGRRRSVPDLRFHELFEQRARAFPDEIAAVRGSRQWTYGELNRRANAIAHTLLDSGLVPEDVVAVVTERSLEWMACVIGVLKAGGVYLPIEPSFPADRMTTMLRRSDCRFVLAEPAIPVTLPDGGRVLRTDEIRVGARETDPGVEVGPHQLAYIYFTSGSTGEPKGAMCEHAGMLNHLFAKIDDLEIGAGDVVAQTAPQCFDISLWQLLAGLVVGGRTLLVEQEVILDVERCVRLLASAGVTVVQFVPSYLDVVLAYLHRHSTTLPALRCVSATGEALKKDLVERFFAEVAGVRLVNAYGLTETSDDTNHEVMHRPPEGERVPLGRAVNNVRVYLVDDQLRLVPLGSSGEIVFSGVCVGRGYINDEARTRQAFLSDPYHEGERLYRSGDIGRWSPDGKLEFLGRRDAQVKIRGFRIEIGEIENRMLAVPGVLESAVVVTERTDGSKHLIGFFRAAPDVPVESVREELAKALPDYMVPAALYRRDELPLTANGKVDKKSLTRLAAVVSEDQAGTAAPRTPTERRIAEAWAEVLGLSVRQISRTDNFFDRGGTSLSAVRLAVKLDRAFSLGDLTRHPVLADLAGVIDTPTGSSDDLLQPLAQPADPRATLVCFPYAGGNAVNFQAMARALGGHGVAVYAVELPGHDLTRSRTPFLPPAEVAERVVQEIVRLGITEAMLWGHSSGAAVAVETAHQLRAAGIAVRRIFVAAQLLGTETARREQLARLDRRTDRQLAMELAAEDHVSLRELDAEHAEHLGAAYRHDCGSAHEYLIAARSAPGPRLSVPLTVVVAEDNATTSGYPTGYAAWRELAEEVELVTLADGGHHFLRTCPDETTQVVLRAVGATVA